ncbi:MAG: glycosyltransferase family 39 protein [Candidatus Saccharicenans sp.]|nr:glycosyltransferase family 39 protein [Candidatus Saccharicenans sp.]
MSDREGTKKIPAIIFLLALFALAGSLIISEVAFARFPFINDEFGYIFQAKIFLTGRLYAPSPCPGEAFDFPHIINNGRWYSQYPPGYPLLLMPFVFLGVPWLLNPLLAAFSVIVIYFLALELFGRRVALLSSLLCALSIWFLVTSATYLSHTANLFFFSLFLLFLFRSIKSPGILPGILAGASLGFAFLIRPYETAWASLPLLIHYLIKFIKAPGEYVKNLLSLAAAAGFFLLLFLGYNFLTNGHPLLTGYEVRYGPEHGIGFGKKGYTETPHTPFRGALLLGENFKAINNYLFGWPLSSLFPLALIFISRKYRAENKKEIILLFSAIATLSFGLFIYWGTFVLVGARQFFTIFSLLIILSATGLTALEQTLPAFIKIGRTGISLNQKSLINVVLILLFSCGFFFTLSKEVLIKGKGDLIPARTRAFRAISFARTFEKLDLKNSLIVLKFLSTNPREFPADGWGPGFIQNNPLLRSPAVFSRKGTLSYEEFFRCFPQRKIYFYWGTYRKGLLIEVVKKDGCFDYGNPVIFKTQKLNSFTQLVSAPEEIFFLYSQDFREFLGEVFQNNPFYQVDAAWLEEQARLSYRAHDFKKAMYYLEAALQVENNCEARYRMLTMLAGLYRGQKFYNLSQKILESVNNPGNNNVYDVLPERGF